tara:strand:- start:1838 stop:2155 length:318 start_codon:yes stop_codon:yes gene_type:complete
MVLDISFITFLEICVMIVLIGAAMVIRFKFFKLIAPLSNAPLIKSFHNLEISLGMAIIALLWSIFEIYVGIGFNFLIIIPLTFMLVFAFRGFGHLKETLLVSKKK